MPFVVAAQQSNLEVAGESFFKSAQSFFNPDSIVALLLSLGIALVAGRITAAFLRRLTKFVSRRADKTADLNKVNSLRRVETFIVLSIAIIRGLFVFAAFYFWWVYIHAGAQPTAFVAGSAILSIFVIGAINPIIRDLTYGSIMMAEHWFGVGDYVKIIPGGEVEGIVDRVTLRSTRVRTISGEIVWVNNQNIQGVRITPRGLRMMAIDFFVSDLEKGMSIIREMNNRLPRNPLMLPRDLSVLSKQELGRGVWHITILGQTVPGREWVLEEYAVKMAKDIDEKKNKKKPVLLHDPVARYADAEAEKGFARTVKNASKVANKKRISLADVAQKPKAVVKRSRRLIRQ